MMEKIIPESHFPLHSRVKIYMLKKNGQWVDQAVGFFQLVKEEPQSTYLRVTQESIQENENDYKIDEECRSKLVQHPEQNTGEYRWEMNLRLHQGIHYDCQGDNIMNWFEGDIQEEIALSFKETSYLRETLHSIDQLQGKKSSPHFRFDEVEAHPVVMPSHQNLDTLQTQIQEHPESFIEGILNTPYFFEQLKKIFEEAEDNEQDHTLEALYHIFRSLIYLKNEKIVLLIMNDQNYMTTFGVLEYHIDHKGGHKGKFRDFLSEKTQFHTIFDDLDDKMVSAINVNYRLTYLKETVMTYYLFQEDPTYIFINQVIQSNNYIIIKTLFTEHLEQFIRLLEQLPQNILQISQFLSEFYIVFIRLPQHFEFRNHIIDLVKKSNMLYLLNISIRDITLDNFYAIEQTQFICQTLLQFELLFMNIDPQKFTDFLFESTASCELFWNNIYLLTISDQIATYPMISDILMTLFPPSYLPNQLFCSEATLLRPQLVQFLQKYKSATNQPQQSLALYQQILENVGNNLPTMTGEYLNLCTPILDLMRLDNNKNNKTNLISAVKFFRFLVKGDQRDVNKYLKESGLADTFLKFKILKRQEGILEGLLRETVVLITKNHTVGQYMVNQVPQEDSIRKSILFEPLFKEFTYVNPQLVQMLPPASPSSKQNHQTTRLEEELYYDDDNNTNNDDEQQDISEKRSKLQLALKKRQTIQEELEDHNHFILTPTHKRQSCVDFQLQFLEFESIEKKVKQNE